MATTSRSTTAKRAREHARQSKQKEKAARRTQRQQNKQVAFRPHDGTEDPDLAGMRWGPQAPLYQ